MILNHLQSEHSITPIEAFHEYGTLSLQWHIWALREDGYQIQTEWVTTVSGKRYAKYVLLR